MNGYCFFFFFFLACTRPAGLTIAGVAWRGVGSSSHTGAARHGEGNVHAPTRVAEAGNFAGGVGVGAAGWMDGWITAAGRRRRGPARARPWRAPASPARRCSRTPRRGALGTAASCTPAPAAPAPSPSSPALVPVPRSSRRRTRPAKRDVAGQVQGTVPGRGGARGGRGVRGGRRGWRGSSGSGRGRRRRARGRPRRAPGAPATGLRRPRRARGAARRAAWWSRSRAPAATATWAPSPPPPRRRPRACACGPSRPPPPQPWWRWRRRAPSRPGERASWGGRPAVLLRARCAVR
uniref:Uncharacterized protein n=1 Tax=Triticum urartu TaxID=4572 RepID=A0A8R7TD18_TRIUA